MVDIMFAIFETSLIMSAAILLLALIIRLLHGTISAARRYVIWVFVAAALLMPIRPIALPIPLPVPPAAQGTAAYETAATPTVAAQAQAAIEMWSRFRSEPSMQYMPMEALPSHAAALPLPSPAGEAGTAREIPAAQTGRFAIENPLALIHMGLFALWAGGGILFALAWILRHGRFMRSVRRLWADACNPAVLDMLEQIRRDLGIRRRIRLMVCPVIPTPVVIGLIRPRIILPEYMLAEEWRKLRLTLFHEALHIRRGDIFTRLLCLIALAVHWFNPLVHWVTRKAMEEAEQATDDAVLAYIGTDSRFQYGEMLLSIAGMNRAPKVGTVLAYGLTGGGKKLKRRLENIVSHVRIPRWMVLGCTLLLFSVVLAFSVVGCDSSGGEARGLAGVETFEALPLSQVTEADRSLFQGETLTIAVFYEGSIQPMVTQFRMRNLGVHVEVICFWDTIIGGRDVADVATAREQIRAMLMDGSAPVLIDGVLADFLDPRMSHHFTDWLPVMAADPDFNEDDWFMNVFHAITTNGQLYAFPTKFTYSFASANMAVPALGEALAARDSVTLPELLELYREFSAGTSFLFDADFNSIWGLEFYLGQFMDFESGWVDFDSQRFIDFITSARDVTSSDDRMFRNGTPLEEEAYLGERYLFQISSLQGFTHHFIDFEAGPFFDNHTPIVNAQGELLVTPFASYVLNAHATPIEQAMAWDFIQLLMNPDNQGHSSYINATNRNVFQSVAQSEWNLPNFLLALWAMYDWQAADTAEEAIAQVVTQMEAFGDMPMAAIGSSAVPAVILDIIHEVLWQFHDGLISAEETARQLQNRITLALVEMGVHS